MIDEIKLSSAFIELQKAVQHKNDDDGGKYVKRAVEILDESLSSDTLVEIISAANYEVKEYGVGFIKSGIDWIDSCIGGGIRREELMIVGGEWHSGKTHMLRFLASQYIIEGLSVLDFNGEDMLDDIVRIYHSSIMQATGEKPVLESLYFVNAMDAGTFSIDTIETAMKQQKTDIVIIDHLDIMDSSIHEQDWLSVHKLTRELKFLAKRYNCIIITGSQAIEGRLFRGNNSKSMDADIIWYIESPITGSLYLETRKGRGRKILEEHKKIVLSVDWGGMIIEPENF